MATLYLDRRNTRLQLDSDTLVVYINNQRGQSIPIHLLDTLVLRASVDLSSSLLAHLADSGVSVVALGGRFGNKFATVQGKVHGEASRRIGQYICYQDASWRCQWANRLVLSKLKRQQRLLENALVKRPDLRYRLSKAINQISSTRVNCTKNENLKMLLGFEGSGASAYFSAYTTLFPESLDFTTRNRRPPKDPVNACLSLGYTLLHAEAIKACYSSGLDPMIGIFHTIEHGRESLASDLIEPMRIKIDDWVWQQFRTRQLRIHHFSRSDEGCLLEKDGRKHFYQSIESVMSAQRKVLRIMALKLAKEYQAVARQRCNL